VPVLLVGFILNPCFTSGWAFVVAEASQTVAARSESIKL